MTATTRRFAWTIAIVLFLGSVVNYVDRAALGVVLPQLRDEIGISNTEYGVAVNAFLIVYTLFYILGGRVADRLGYRMTFVAIVTLWSVAEMSHALVAGLLTLCLFRALLGIGEGAFYPTAIRGATEWFTPKDRAKAIGLLLCGTSMGAALAPPIVAWLTINFSWRYAFVGTGMLGLLLLPPWLWVHHRVRQTYGVADPAPALDAANDATQDNGISLGGVLRRKKYWLVLSTRMLGDSAWYFYLFWLAAYFQDERGFTLEMVGRFLWIPFAAADVGSLAGAWASSGLIRRGWSLEWARKGVTVASGLCCIIGAGSGFVPGAFVALTLASLALFGHLSWSSNIHTIITEICPPRHVAALYGITGAAGTLMGALLSPLIGLIIDTHGYPPMFAGAAASYMVAIGLLFAAGRIEQIR